MWFSKKQDNILFDDSTNYLDIAMEYKTDPLQLVYLVNYLTKRYTFNRSHALLFGNLINDWQQDFPNIEVLPRKLFSSELHNSSNKEVANMVNLQSSSIILWVWNKLRLINCIKHIGTDENPWKEDPGNHNVKWFCRKGCTRRRNLLKYWYS